MGASKSKLFGSSLTHESVKRVVIPCCEFLAEFGYDREGLFGSEPNRALMTRLMSAFSAKKAVDLTFYRGSPNTVAGVLAHFLNNLPESIFESVPQVTVLGETQLQACITACRRALSGVDEARLAALQALLPMLHKVASSPLTKMSPLQLAACFDRGNESVRATLAFLIRHHEAIFRAPFPIPESEMAAAAAGALCGPGAGSPALASGADDTSPGVVSPSRSPKAKTRASVKIQTTPPPLPPPVSVPTSSPPATSSPPMARHSPAAADSNTGRFAAAFAASADGELRSVRSEPSIPPPAISISVLSEASGAAAAGGGGSAGGATTPRSVDASSRAPSPGSRSRSSSMRADAPQAHALLEAARAAGADALAHALARLTPRSPSPGSAPGLSSSVPAHSLSSPLLTVPTASPGAPGIPPLSPRVADASRRPPIVRKLSGATNAPRPSSPSLGTPADAAAAARRARATMLGMRISSTGRLRASPSPQHGEPPPEAGGTPDTPRSDSAASTPQSTPVLSAQAGPAAPSLPIVGRSAVGVATAPVAMSAVSPVDSHRLGVTPATAAVPLQPSPLSIGPVPAAPEDLAAVVSLSALPAGVRVLPAAAARPASAATAGALPSIVVPQRDATLVPGPSADSAAMTAAAVAATALGTAGTPVAMAGPTATAALAGASPAAVPSAAATSAATNVPAPAAAVTQPAVVSARASGDRTDSPREGVAAETGHETPLMQRIRSLHAAVTSPSQPVRRLSLSSLVGTPGMDTARSIAAESGLATPKLSHTIDTPSSSSDSLHTRPSAASILGLTIRARTDSNASGTAAPGVGEAAAAAGDPSRSDSQRAIGIQIVSPQGSRSRPAVFNSSGEHQPAATGLPAGTSPVTLSPASGSARSSAVTPLHPLSLDTQSAAAGVPNNLSSNQSDPTLAGVSPAPSPDALGARGAGSGHSAAGSPGLAGRPRADTLNLQLSPELDPLRDADASSVDSFEVSSGAGSDHEGSPLVGGRMRSTSLPTIVDAEAGAGGASPKGSPVVAGERTRHRHRGARKRQPPPPPNQQGSSSLDPLSARDASAAGSEPVIAGAGDGSPASAADTTGASAGAGTSAAAGDATTPAPPMRMSASSPALGARAPPAGRVYAQGESNTQLVTDPVTEATTLRDDDTLMSPVSSFAGSASDLLLSPLGRVKSLTAVPPVPGPLSSAPAVGATAVGLLSPPPRERPPSSGSNRATVDSGGAPSRASHQSSAVSVASSVGVGEVSPVAAESKSVLSEPILASAGSDSSLPAATASESAVRRPRLIARQGSLSEAAMALLLPHSGAKVTGLARLSPVSVASGDRPLVQPEAFSFSPIPARPSDAAAADSQPSLSQPQPVAPLVTRHGSFGSATSARAPVTDTTAHSPAPADTAVRAGAGAGASGSEAGSRPSRHRSAWASSSSSSLSERTDGVSTVTGTNRARESAGESNAVTVAPSSSSSSSPSSAVSAELAAAIAPLAAPFEFTRPAPFNAEVVRRRQGAFQLRDGSRLLSSIERLEKRMDVRLQRIARLIERRSRFAAQHPEAVPELREMNVEWRRDLASLMQSMQRQHEVLTAVALRLALPLDPAAP